MSWSPIAMTSALCLLVSAAIHPQPVNAQNCVPAPSGIVSWWSGDHDLTDLVGPTSGELRGGVHIGTGAVDGAFRFNSNDDTVRIANRAALNPSAAGFSVEFWMRADGPPPSSLFALVDKSHGFTDSLGWTFQARTDTNQLGFLIGAGGGTASNFPGATATTNLIDGAYHHIAGTFDGQIVRLYVDGVERGAAPHPGPANNARNLLFAHAWGGGSDTRFFRGVIDEVSVYSRALTGAEVSAIHGSGSAGKCKFTPAESCLDVDPDAVGWWSGDDDFSDTIGGNDGVAVGGAWFTGGKSRATFTFDSNDDGVRVSHQSNLNPDSTQGFSVEFWMRGARNQPQTLFTVVDKSHGFVDSTGWTFQSDWGSGLSFIMCQGGSSTNNCIGAQGGVDMLDGVFHHVVGTWDGATSRIYVDGLLRGSAPVSFVANNTRELVIGHAWGGGNRTRFFRGAVDELLVYRRTLSAGDVMAAYQAGSAGYCRGDEDADGDGVVDPDDNCVDVSNPDQDDADQDGLGDACDGCPLDSAKTEPGVCDCGTLDVDSDADQVLDCNDGCPSDPDKTSPGVCDCGTADTDTDSDQVPDCNDGCPSDPDKTSPGVCDCGTADTDTDSDQVPDCNDGCPSDPNKTSPGVCGCGTADTDTDSDQVPDCNDPCPTIFGGDTDNDGFCDLNDVCPLVADDQTDTDNDGVGDACETGFDVQAALDELRTLVFKSSDAIAASSVPYVNGLVTKIAGNGGVLKKVEDAVAARLAGTLSDSDYKAALMTALNKLGTYESLLLVKSGDPKLAPYINDLWDWAYRMRAIIEAMIANP